MGSSVGYLCAAPFQDLQHWPQVMRCADKGADMVRITIQGRQEALAGQKIRDKLFQKGYCLRQVIPEISQIRANSF